MLRGFFDDDGRPHIGGDIDLPDLDAGGHIPFLLDTGSDITCLMPKDGRRLGVDYSSIKSWPHKSWGIGGFVNTAKQWVWVYFTESNEVTRYYRLLIDIMPDIESLQWAPSLLGQDILARWRVVHEPASELLRVTVRSADLTLRL